MPGTTTGQTPDVEGRPEGGPEGAWQGEAGVASTGLNIGSHPDYVVEWEPGKIDYLVGEIRPLKWKIWRVDGGLVDFPSAGGITVTLPDGSTLLAAPDMESSDSVATAYAA